MIHVPTNPLNQPLEHVRVEQLHWHAQLIKVVIVVEMVLINVLILVPISVLLMHPVHVVLLDAARILLGVHLKWYAPQHMYYALIV
jgi:hypothetical protein